MSQTCSSAKKKHATKETKQKITSKTQCTKKNGKKEQKKL